MIVAKYRALRQLKLNPVVFRLQDSFVREHVLAAGAISRSYQTRYVFSVLKEDRRGLHYSWWTHSFRRSYDLEYPSCWGGRYERTELFE